MTLGVRRGEDLLQLAAWLRRVLKTPRLDAAAFHQQVQPHLPELLLQSGVEVPGRFVSLDTRGDQLLARFDFSEVAVPGFIDQHGAALIAPPERRELPIPCRICPDLKAFCEIVPIVATPAFSWRQLGLIEPGGAPTTRGILFSFFHHGEGLAVAAALEDDTYPIAELLFDLANLRAGPRFAGDDSPYGGRLGALCQRIYDRADLPGYLEMGVPLDYGAGASEVVRELVEHNIPRTKLLTESLRQGDIERALIEWRSLLRHIVWAPDYDHARWHEIKSAARAMLENTTSPTIAIPSSKSSH